MPDEVPVAADTPPLVTARLLLRAWRPEEADVQHALWSERDPRVPARRRLDEQGRPSVSDLADAIARMRVTTTGLLALERRTEGDVVGYCGLVDSGRDPAEPELAFELLRRVHGRGYATEASWAVLDWARASGFVRLWATVWDWNLPSRRVLAKLGFTETDEVDGTSEWGTSLVTVLELG